MNNKKIFLTLIIACFAAAILFGSFKAFNQNKQNRYSIGAEWEQVENNLYFTAKDTIFVWELREDDRIPKGKAVLLIMDNNGTEDFFADDKIVCYW